MSINTNLYKENQEIDKHWCNKHIESFCLSLQHHDKLRSWRVWQQWALSSRSWQIYWLARSYWKTWWNPVDMQTLFSRGLHMHSRVALSVLDRYHPEMNKDNTTVTYMVPLVPCFQIEWSRFEPWLGSLSTVVKRETKINHADKPHHVLKTSNLFGKRPKNVFEKSKLFLLHVPTFVSFRKLLSRFWFRVVAMVFLQNFAQEIDVQAARIYAFAHARVFDHSEGSLCSVFGQETSTSFPGSLFLTLATRYM